METTLTVVLPVFGLLAVGWGVARLGIVDERGVRGIAQLVLHVLIPALLFRSLAREHGLGPLELGVAGAFFLACLVVYAVAMLVARRFFAAALDAQAFMGMSATFGNTVQMGIPLVALAYGPRGEAPLLAIITFHSLILISLTTVLIEVAQHRGKGPLDTLRQSLAALLTHPIILAILAGIAWGLTGWHLPLIADRFLTLLGVGAGPMALLSLGAALNGLRIAGDLRETLAVTALKLVAMPALVWLVAAKLLALPPLEVAVATVAAAMPTGANVFILARRYDLYLRRAASMVLISTVASVATIAIILVLLRPD
ncbi:MAG: AEC family transporter [Alphaproteobacteria bacterium]|nr:AEC family transporter [Alphaproteobacteria bacterium]